MTDYLEYPASYAELYSTVLPDFEGQTIFPGHTEDGLMTDKNTDTVEQKQHNSKAATFGEALLALLPDAIGKKTKGDGLPSIFRDAAKAAGTKVAVMFNDKRAFLLHAKQNDMIAQVPAAGNIGLLQRAAVHSYWWFAVEKVDDKGRVHVVMSQFIDENNPTEVERYILPKDAHNHTWHPIAYFNL